MKSMELIRRIPYSKDEGIIEWKEVDDND